MGDIEFSVNIILYTWGANSYGQLGQGHAEDRCEPRTVDWAQLAVGLLSLEGGGAHSALVTKTGQVFVCGQNHKGQLGLNHTSDVTTFHLCSSLGQRTVCQVSCGWDFTLVLTDCGQVLACGSNTYGQLGLPQVAGHSTELLHLQDLTYSVLNIAAGLRHSLAVDGRSCVYQWGTGLSNQAKKALAPQPVPAHFTSRQPYPVPALDRVTPRSVTAGAAHCVCLTEEGDVFLWGGNKQGQLGGAGPFQALPRALDRALLGGESTTHVWSGWTHLVARTESGRIFTWGRGDYGQLGRTAPSNQCSSLRSDSLPASSMPMICRPTEVKALTGATQVACGSEHNLAIVGSSLLSWGWNEHGMCGDGSCVDVAQPVPVDALHDTTPLVIGCGAGHSMALCAASPTDSTIVLPEAASTTDVGADLQATPN